MADICRVDWDPDALSDLLEIAGFIAQDSPLDARRAAARLTAAANTLRRHPQRCRRVPELAGLPDVAGLALEIRELIVKPWRLTYAIESRVVRVVAVVDSRRDMVAWLERHLPRLSRPSSR